LDRLRLCPDTRLSAKNKSDASKFGVSQPEVKKDSQRGCLFYCPQNTGGAGMRSSQPRISLNYPLTTT